MREGGGATKLTIEKMKAKREDGWISCEDARPCAQSESSSSTTFWFEPTQSSR